MLGKLKLIDLRSVWKNEEYDFSKWMSEQENFQLLCDELGFQLIVKETEASVGRYSVDLLATEDGTDNVAIIENQLEATDHDHLGKLLTYAAGLNASYIIWVASEIRDEHLNAIEWINENTNDNKNFFLVKIEMWQIDNSNPSPKFTVVAKPNDFAKNMKISNSGEITDTKAKQLDFWISLKEYIDNQKNDLKIQKPSPQHWINYSIGTSNAHCSFIINSQTNSLFCELYIDENKELYSWLFERKEEIENKIGKQLDWRELPNKKASRILLGRDGDLNNKEEFEEYFKWFVEYGLRFKKVFGEYIKNFG
jgi:hypothetical protein